MKTPRFRKGSRVRVDGWGLRGLSLVVIGAVGDGYFDLAFVHNGNRVPNHWHRNMLRRES